MLYIQQIALFLLLFAELTVKNFLIYFDRYVCKLLLIPCLLHKLIIN